MNRGEGHRENEPPSRNEGTARTPIELFVDYVTDLRSGREASLESLLESHPEHRDELTDLHAKWTKTQAILRNACAGPSSESHDGAHGASSDVLKELEQRRFDSETRYEHLGVIARGGMGTIELVRDRVLDRELAMKRLRVQNEAPTKPPRLAMARFLEEAFVTSQLDHPGIVPVHDLGVDDEGVLYFTMKLVRGRDLREVLENRNEDAPRWTRTRLLGVLLQVCDALSYAHAKNIVHRDIKPANIMVGPFGEVFVMDWGLARREGSDGHRPFPTRAGEVVGTPAYMAPEQALGAGDATGPGADVYSVGALLYEILTARPPFDAPSSREILEKVRSSTPEPLGQVAPDTPAELVAITEMAMARDPQQRYPTVRELADDLRAHLDLRVVRAHRTGAFVELRKWIARNRLVAATSALLMITLMSSLALWVYVADTRDEVRTARRAEATLQFNRLLESAYFELAEGDPERGAASLERALEIRPGAPEAIAAHALHRIEQERPEAALELLEGHPGTSSSVGLRRIHREVLLQTGRIDASNLVEALDVEPESALDCYLLGSYEILRGHRGDVPRFRTAVSLLERAVWMAPDPRPLYYHALAHALGHESGHALAVGHDVDRQRVRGLAEALLANWPESGENLHWVGFLLQGAGLGRDCIEILEPEFAERGEPRGRFSLVRSYVDAGRLDDAIALLEASKSGAGHEASFQRELAELYLRKGRLEDALAWARRALETRNRLQRSEVLAGRVLLALHRPSEALPLLEQAAERAPGWPYARFQLARCLAHLRRLDEARALYQGLIDRHPGYAAAHDNLGKLEVSRGDRTAALTHALRAVEIEPTSPGFLSRLASLQCDQGELDEAEATVSRLREAHPEHPDTYGATGYLELKRGNARGAETEFRRALACAPESFLALFGLASILLSEKRFEEAVAIHRRVVALARYIPRHWFDFGLAARKSFQLDVAKSAFEECIRLEPDRSSTWNNQSSVLREMMEFEEATKHTLRAVELDPRSRNALWNHGINLRDTGRFEEAIPVLAKARELFSSPRSRERLAGFERECAESLERLASLDEVLDTLESLPPEELEACWKACRRTGRHATAMRLANHALASAPGDPAWQFRVAAEAGCLAAGYGVEATGMDPGEARTRAVEVLDTLLDDYLEEVDRAERSAEDLLHRLRRWKHFRDLRSLREEASPSGLEPDSIEPDSIDRCRSLWTRIDTTIERLSKQVLREEAAR